MNLLKFFKKSYLDKSLMVGIRWQYKIILHCQYMSHFLFR
jgi:hypothetical protein